MSTRTKARNPQDDNQGHLSEFLPWLISADKNTVLCKDGSVLGAFRFIGLTPDEHDNQILAQTFHELKHMLQSLDERFCCWFVTDKRRMNRPDKWEGLQSNFVAEKLLNARRRDHEAGKVYRMNTTIFLTFTGDVGVDKFMEQVRRRVANDGMSLPKALLVSLNPGNQFKSAALRDHEQLQENINKAELGFRQFISRSNHIRFERLTGFALTQALSAMSNITFADTPKHETLPSRLLDGALALSAYKFGRNTLACYGPDRTVYTAALSMQNYPEQFQQFARIAALPMEFRLVQCIHFMSEHTAHKTLTEWGKYYRMNMTGMIRRMVAQLSNAEPEPDPGKLELFEQAQEALARHTSEGLGFIQHSMTLMPIASSTKELEKLVDEINSTLSNVPMIRERTGGLKAAVLSTLPGNWQYNKRLMLVNTEVAASAIPVTSAHAGPAHCKHLSEEVYKRPVPVAATFNSAIGTQINYDLFDGQVGHSLLVMPTGGGKTTFVNYALSMFSRYPDAQVIIFDRNNSCKVLTYLMEGSHIDLKSKGMQLNPLSEIRKSPIELTRARDFLIRRVEDAGERLDAKERAEIFDNLKMLAASDAHELRLGTVWMLLPEKVKPLMSEWVLGGPFEYFDSTEDELQISRWTCIEMREIMKVERLCRAFLDHAFAVIERNLDGRPTFIYIEEASFMLKSPAFLKGLDEWLKTFRKLNAFVWLTVQSPESLTSVAGDEIRHTLTDNVPTLILGANSRLESHRELYKKVFGMTDAQVNMVGHLTPKRDYLVVRDSICNRMVTNFGDDVLALIRSEPRYQTLVEEAYRRGGEGWREWYLKEALK